MIHISTFLLSVSAEQVSLNDDTTIFFKALYTISSNSFIVISLFIKWIFQTLKLGITFIHILISMNIHLIKLIAPTIINSIIPFFGFLFFQIMKYSLQLIVTIIKLFIIIILNIVKGIFALHATISLTQKNSMSCFQTKSFELCVHITFWNIFIWIIYVWITVFVLGVIGQIGTSILKAIINNIERIRFKKEESNRKKSLQIIENLLEIHHTCCKAKKISSILKTMNQVILNY